jgi:hypothetical protein
MIDDIRERMQRVPFRVVVVDDEGTTAILGPLHINSVIEQPNGE